MFPLSVALLVACGPLPEVAKNTESLELSVRVVEAFEHGPVILDVTVTNRGDESLPVTTYGSQPRSEVIVPASWHRGSPRRDIWCGGAGLVLQETLKPGKSWTERHTLHLTHTLIFPPGRHEVAVDWPMRFSPQDGESRLVAYPTKTFPITITAATAENRKALAARLEAEFAALPPDAEGDFRDPLYVFAEKLDGTAHQELIPLALRVLDRSSASRVLGTVVPDRMVWMVFRADAEAAHRIFVDRLLAASPQINPPTAFHVWRCAPESGAEIGRSIIHRLIEPVFWLNPELWGEWFRSDWLPHEELRELLYWGTEYAPTILPAAELRRLTTAKDFRVRAWTYYVFGHQLGDEWRADFLKEARQWAEKPAKDDDRVLERLVWRLDPDQPHARKLLDVFAAGADENPITKPAREELARHEKEKQKREP
jgi:hypothetical protein